MTIKEIEEQTGMSRANVRFYESEGLLTPRRKENGYRIYEEAHVELLLRIKLLRALDLPLDDIRAMQQGSLSLEEALLRHRNTMDQKERQLARGKLVLDALLAEKRSFDTLQPEAYLLKLETEGSLRQDIPRKYNLPVRRYLARGLDYATYLTVLYLIFLKVDVPQMVMELFAMIAMLLLEPLLLHLFCTTPGKAVFGIHVTGEDGPLSYQTALERTWVVLWEGEGLRIPIVNWYFLFKSHEMAENDMELPWESNSELTFRDDKMWRYGLYALIVLVEIILLWYLFGGSTV